jgi:hypothetical protein
MMMMMIVIIMMFANVHTASAVHVGNRSFNSSHLKLLKHSLLRKIYKNYGNKTKHALILFVLPHEKQ